MDKVRKAAAGRPARAPRGRKPIFRRDDVIRAALALVDREGCGALSMRAIAAALGTGVATLYHYFGSLAELKDALAIVLLDEIPMFEARDAAETRAQLKAMAMTYAKLAARHPDLDLMVGALAHQRILHLLDSALRSMVSAGVDIERAGVAWSVLQGLAQSHAMSSRRLRNGQADLRRMLKGLDAVRTLAGTGYLDASLEQRFSQVLDLTLDRMLPELKARAARR